MRKEFLFFNNGALNNRGCASEKSLMADLEFLIQIQVCLIALKGLCEGMRKQ